MREAVIIDTARTAIGKAYRGAFNNTEAPALGGHVIRAMMARQDLDPGLIDDVVIGRRCTAGHPGLQSRSPLRHGLGSARLGCRYDYGSPVRLWNDGHCHRGQVDYVQ